MSLRAVVEEPVRRFSFDFSELAPRPRPAPELHLLEAECVALPAGASRVEARGRPPARAGRLLPFVRASRPLRVEVRGEAAPAFGARLRESLAALFAALGRPAGGEACLLDDGFAFGYHGLAAVPARPLLRLVTAELWPGSVRLALDGLGPADRVVLNGALPRLDGRLGLPAGLARERLVRLPLCGPAELAAQAAGGVPGGGLGRALVRLAREIAVAYVEADR